MRKMFIICLLIFAVLSGNVFADSWYDNDTGDGLWRTAGNWLSGIPTIAAGWAAVSAPVTLTIDSSTAAECAELYLGHGATEGGQILNITGGTLAVSVNLWLGVTDYEGTITLNMSGGIVNCLQLVPAGGAGNQAIGSVTGGTINATTFAMPWSDLATNSATFYLDGGTINVSGDFVINPRGLLEIGGGELVIGGDQTASINTYITDGQIVLSAGADPRATLSVEFDGTNTTVSTFISDAKQAWNPTPEDGAYYVSKQPTLTWTDGEGAISHDVYFGKYGEELVWKSNQVASYYDQLPVLEWGQAYTWRVDEYDGTTPITGLEWTFTVTDHILVEDFDGYADADDLALVWSPTDANSLDSDNYVGIYLKTGTQSFKLPYDNSVSPYYTEISRSFSSDQDWTYEGLAAISLYFKFETPADFEGLYVEIVDGTNTAVLTDAVSFAGIDTAIADFQEITLSLSDFTGVDLTKIRSIAIGMGSKTTPIAGNVNTVYIDEIRLYQSRCLEGAPVGDITDDCKVDIEDFAVIAENWLTDGLWPN